MINDHGIDPQVPEGGRTSGGVGRLFSQGFDDE
jgi:hypothetical protein